jgi:hypothetical protein
MESACPLLFEKRRQCPMLVLQTAEKLTEMVPSLHKYLPGPQSLRPCDQEALTMHI